MTWQQTIDEEKDIAFEEGRAEGREEGREEGRIEAVENFLREGDSLERDCWFLKKNCWQLSSMARGTIPT